MITVRHVTDADYEAVAAIASVTRPEPFSALTGPDVPDYEPDEPFPSYETFRKLWMEYTEPRFVAVALDGERVVGSSMLAVNTRLGYQLVPGPRRILKAL